MPRTPDPSVVYDGPPCRHCRSTQRYALSGRCAPCKRRTVAAYASERRGLLAAQARARRKRNDGTVRKVT